MKREILSLVALTVLAAAPAYAQPEAYSVAWDNVFDGAISSTGGIVGIVGPQDSTQANATLTGTPGGSMSDNGSGPQGPVIVSLGTPTQTAGTFTQVGQQPTSYSIGEAQIISTQSLSGVGSVQAVNKAESNVVAPPSGNSATASGLNSSATLLSSVFSTSGTVSFSFMADPYLNVFLSSLTSSGSEAEASIDATVTIKNSAGTIVFQWAPVGDGTSGGDVTGTIGGTVASDPFSLQSSITQLSPGSSSVGTDTVGNTSTSPSGAGSFAATTGTLPFDTYTLTLAMNEDTTDLANTTIPEPGTIVLLGVGLLGLAVGTRRKRS